LTISARLATPTAQCVQVLPTYNAPFALTKQSTAHWSSIIRISTLLLVRALARMVNLLALLFPISAFPVILNVYDARSTLPIATNALSTTIFSYLRTRAFPFVLPTTTMTLLSPPTTITVLNAVVGASPALGLACPVASHASQPISLDH
jgi:hypothetical protein